MSAHQPVGVSTHQSVCWCVSTLVSLLVCQHTSQSVGVSAQKSVGVSAHQSVSAHRCTARSIGHGTVHNTSTQKQFRSLASAPCPQIKAYTRIYTCLKMSFRAFAKLRKAIISFVMSLCRYVRPSAWNNSDPTGRIFMKLDIWVFFRKVARKSQVPLRSNSYNRYFTCRPIYIFDHISLNSS